STAELRAPKISSAETLVLSTKPDTDKYRPPAGASRRQHFLHFVDQFAQVHGLGEHLGVLRRRRIGIKRDRREAGDEHDLDVGVELGGAAGELDAIHLRHYDVGQQQLERLL